MRRVLLAAGLAWAGCVVAPWQAQPRKCGADQDCRFVEVCQSGACRVGPLGEALPPLPPVGGTGGAVARVITDRADLLTGNAAHGRLGDVLIRNSTAAYILQKPGRDIGPLPFGGNVLDAVSVVGGAPQPDEFGEIQPLLNLGMTVDFRDIEIIRDGSTGGPAVVRAYGRPSLWDFVNLGAFLSEGLSTLIPFEPDGPLPVRVVATYTLQPDSPVLRVTYTLVNDGEYGLQMPVGVVVDSGGAVEPFRAEGGFGTPDYSLQGILDGSKPVPWFGFTGRAGGAAIRPHPVTPPLAGDSTNPTVQVAGVTVSIFSRPDILAALSESEFFLDAHGTGSFGFDLAAAGPSLADASAALLRQQGRNLHSFRVRVTDTAGPVAGALVLVRAVNNQGELVDAIATGRTGPDGEAPFATPPGPRVVQVRAEGYVSPTPQDILGDVVDVGLSTAGRLSYRFLLADRVDSPGLAPAPCRVTVYGPPQWTDPALTAADADAPHDGIAAVRYSATCSSDDDGPIAVAPGRYLVVATAGPDFDHWEGLVDVGTSSAAVAGTLHRVVSGTGYVATDWHQHTLNSPDSPIPLRDRLIANMAEGIALFGGTDHDVITDWEALVEEFGYSSRIRAINGVETTPFEYGHFNAFPLAVDPARPSGGAVDWAGGSGPGLAPPQIWEAQRALGARVVQVNHPRSLGGSPFQAYFDVAALTFEFNPAGRTGTARGDVGAQPYSNTRMRIPEGEPMWGTGFDCVEIFNGFAPYPGAVATRRAGDRRADRILLDVANMILVGLRPVMTGVSDTHKLKRGDTGYPRTYVRVRRPPAGALPDPWEVLGALAGRSDTANRGDVVVSSTPIPVVTARANNQTVSPGGLLRAAGPVDLTVEVQAPAWMGLDTADVIVSPGGMPTPSNDAPELTVAAAAALTPQDTLLPNGGTRRTWRASFAVDLAVANPFPGRDATLLVRVHGRQVLWPVLLDGLRVAVDESATTPQTFLTVTGGVPPYAVTNPVFVDVDGDGRFRGAFEP
ncbi:MAG: hypothetical protein HY904_25715 [Deltaproteobacteria bacterium]|nr:hypothetical protein [Deltaproteobacteria bacterium]